MLIAFANSLDPECQCADSFCNQCRPRVSVCFIAFANSFDPECQCADSFCKQFGSRVSVC